MDNSQDPVVKQFASQQGLYFCQDQPNKNCPTCSMACAAFLMGNIWNTCHISCHSSIRRPTQKVEESVDFSEKHAERA